jgi:hypothetical protein
MATKEQSIFRLAQVPFTDREKLAELAEEELLRREAIRELSRRGIRTPIDDEQDIDIDTGLQDIPTRIKMGFVTSDKERLNVLQKKYPDAQKLDDGRLAYTNPATKKLTVVDEEGLTLGDLADLAGLLPEMGGATIGALATSPIPVPGARPLGAALGASAGEVIRSKIEERITGTLPEPGERATRLLTSAGGAMTGEAIGGTITKSMAPFAKRIQPKIRQSIETLKRYGGYLTPSQATEARGLDILENIAEGSLMGGEPFRVFKEETQRQALFRWSRAIAGTAGKKASPEEIGVITKAAIENSTKVFHRATKVLYKNVDELAKEVTVDTVDIRKSARRMMREAVIISPVSKKALAPTLRSRTAVRILKDFINLPSEISFAEAQELRSSLSALSRNLIANDVLPAKMAGVAKTLTKTINESIDKRGYGLTGEALDAFNKANTFYREGKELFNSTLIKSLAKMNPEAIGKAVIKPGQITNIKQLKKVVDKDTFKSITRGYLEDLLQPDPSTKVIKGKALINKLVEMGNESLNEMFSYSPSIPARLKEFALVAGKVEAGTGVGTGKVLIQLTQGGAALTLAGSALQSMSGGGEFPEKRLLGATTILLGPAMLARMFTNPVMIKWLTTGLQISPASKEGVHLGSRILSQLAKEKVLFPTSYGQEGIKWEK